MSPFLRPGFFLRSHTYQHCVFLFGLLQHAHLHCLTWPIWPPPPMQRSRLTHVFKQSILLSPLVIPSLDTLIFLVVFLYLLLRLPPDLLRVLQWNARSLRASTAKVLHFISSHPVDLICIKEYKLPHLLLSGFLDTLLCDLIALTRSGILSLDDPHARGGIIIFLWQGSSFS